MGSEISTSINPKFEVKAIGSFKQLPGCPDYVQGLMPLEEIERLCLNECYNPSDERNLIDRIEIVKINPTINIENLPEAISDPGKYSNVMITAKAALLPLKMKISLKTKWIPSIM
ncbi:MAG: hypothetical protein CM15mP86_02970 [Gammaproteobacteria bacterium]|nr:MAG: hypothetical protein CM15mP86_02970 [Gammaproteobacteria bacterium]